LHIAGAVGTPLVGLFGPTDPDRNGPWAAGDRTVSRHDACDCAYRRQCRRRAWCLADITVEEVTRAVEERVL
jgi:ADP-heptose:LPS heptosyltransferase